MEIGAVSVRSLKTLTKEGAMRLAVEVLGLFVVVSVLYVVAIEPVLHSTFPNVYAQTGLDYSPTSFPDTTSEITHLFSSLVVVGSFCYWRLFFTETGELFRNAVLEDARTNSDK